MTESSAPTPAMSAVVSTLVQVRDRGREALTVPVRIGSRVAPGRVQRKLADATRLHLACGGNLLAGWANLDLGLGRGVIGFDLTRPLPVATGSIDFIYSEHFIEHIGRPQALRLVRECHRALRPGGVLRLSTPDLAKLVSVYQSGRTDEWHDVDWRPATPCQLVNEGMRNWGHQFVYDRAELTGLLHEGGFGTVTDVAWRASDHPELQNLECRPFHEEIIVEATR